MRISLFLSAFPRVGLRTDVQLGRTCIQRPIRTVNPKERPRWGVITTDVLRIGRWKQPWRVRAIHSRCDDGAGGRRTTEGSRRARGWNRAHACARDTRFPVWDGVGATSSLCFDRLPVGRGKYLERCTRTRWTIGACAGTVPEYPRWNAAHVSDVHFSHSKHALHPLCLRCRIQTVLSISKA